MANRTSSNRPAHHDVLLALRRDFKTKALEKADGRTVGSDTQRDRGQVGIVPDKLREQGCADAAMAMAWFNDERQFRRSTLRVARHTSAQPDRSQKSPFAFVEREKSEVAGASPVVDEAPILWPVHDIECERFAALRLERLIKHSPEEFLVLGCQRAEHVISWSKHVGNNRNTPSTWTGCRDGEQTPGGPNESRRSPPYFSLGRSEPAANS